MCFWCKKHISQLPIGILVFFFSLFILTEIQVTVHLYISKLYEYRQSSDFSVAILTIKITQL